MSVGAIFSSVGRVLEMVSTREREGPPILVNDDVSGRRPAWVVPDNRGGRGKGCPGMKGQCVSLDASDAAGVDGK